MPCAEFIERKSFERCVMRLGRITTVRLKIEQNQLARVIE